MIDPKFRRRAREKAIQFLYGIDMTQYNAQDVIEEFWATFPERTPVRQYANLLISGVNERRVELDAFIDGALMNWSADRVGKIERNILRVALYEMNFVDDVPRAVAMDEAIELAKDLAAPEAPRFVNGVLDRLRDVNIEETSA